MQVLLRFLHPLHFEKSEGGSMHAFRLILWLCVASCSLSAAPAAGQWVSRPVASGDVSAPRVVSTSTNELHASFISWASGSLNYANFNGTTWATEEVAAEFTTFPDMKLTQGGLPAIGYGAPDSNSVYVATRGVGGWAFEEIPFEFNDIQWFSAALAIDQADQPAVAFMERDSSNVCHVLYAQRESSSWVLEEVDQQNGGDLGTFMEMEFDSQGRANLLYYRPQTGSLLHAVRETDGWTVQEVLAGGQSRMAIDQSGRLHVAYQRFNSTQHRDLMYAVYDGANWLVEEVDVAPNTGWNLDIAVSADGVPHICYTDYGSQTLKYARRDGSGWQIQDVTDDVFYAQYEYRPNGITVDEQGIPHILYVTSNYGLAYATIPEPSLVLLPACALVALAYRRRRRQTH